MRPLLACALLPLGVLAGCNSPEVEEGPSAAKGRYAGVGIYSPGPMWEQLGPPAASGNPAVATLRDDEKIIVVTDTRTGELRQCGNLSGHCIALNPWAKPLAPGHAAPVRVLKHAHQLQAERQGESDAAAEDVAQ